MQLLNVFRSRIRPIETEEKRHEGEHDGRSFHGSEEKVIDYCHLCEVIIVIIKSFDNYCHHAEKELNFMPYFLLFISLEYSDFMSLILYRIELYFRGEEDEEEEDEEDDEKLEKLGKVSSKLLLASFFLSFLLPCPPYSIINLDHRLITLS